jgi:1,4-alpha-glucan branching enzyme
MASKKNRVEFKLFAPRAKQVLLSGTFNQWSENADPMTRDESGFWRKRKMLAKDIYEYKFIIDGEWTIDPMCCNTILNRHGTLNSVIEL